MFDRGWRSVNLDLLGKWLGWLLMAGYVALTVTEIPRFFSTALGPAAAASPIGDPPVSRRRLLLEVLAAYVLSRLLVVLVCAVGFAIQEKGLS